MRASAIDQGQGLFSIGSVLAGTALSFGLHALYNIGRELTGLGH